MENYIFLQYFIILKGMSARFKYMKTLDRHLFE